jgi:hypothetical protein
MRAKASALTLPFEYLRTSLYLRVTSLFFL